MTQTASHSKSELILNYVELAANHHMADLQRFADNRLRTARRKHPTNSIPAIDAEDLLQQVLFDALLGTSHENLGRHPRTKHLADIHVFLNWLRSGINSHLDNLMRKEPKLSFRIPQTENTTSSSPDEDLIKSERLQRLFQDLKNRFQTRPGNLRIIEHLESECFGPPRPDNSPDFDRRRMAEVRHAAISLFGEE